MQWKRTATWFAVLCPMALQAVLLAAHQSTTIQPGKRIYVVAVRDARLFTMCIPNSDQIKAKTRSTDPYDAQRPGNNQLLIYPSHNCHWSVRFPGRPPISVPVPMSSSQECEDKYPLRPILQPSGPDGVQPIWDGTQPDGDIKYRVEKEFLKQKRYLLADSLDQADYVFFVEARYNPNLDDGPPNPNEQSQKQATPWYSRLSGYYKTTHLESVFALVVPSAVYRNSPSDGAALLAARLWDGESVGYYGLNPRGHQSTQTDLEFGFGMVIGPSPEDLVKQFHNKSREPRLHAPLCLAAKPPFSGIKGTVSDESKASLDKVETVVPISDQNQVQTPGEVNTIKLDVTFVTVPVMVIGSNGQYVHDLKESDFRLYENGVGQKIERFIPAAEPVNVALLIDASPSGIVYRTPEDLKRSLEDIQRSALAFVDKMRPEDRFMVVSFNDEVRVESEFTSDRDQLRRAILQTQVFCCSRLYDAVDMVLTERLRSVQGPKAIVLFVASQDTCSRLVTADKTLAKIEEAGVPVYAVQFETKLSYYPSLKNAAEYLVKLTEGSGGRYFLTKSAVDLPKSISQIEDELHNQYTLCYYPSDRAGKGEFRHLSVFVDQPGVKVRAPVGYRAKF